MELDQPEQPRPTTIALLGRVLQVQAVCYMIAALAASVAYLVRGGDALDLGGYAGWRTNPVTMLVVGLGAGGLLFWLSRRISARRLGTHRLVTVAEWVLLLDGVAGFAAGIFNLWWIIGLLGAFAAVWLLRHDDTERYLD
jgi:hypothetical protein